VPQFEQKIYLARLSQSLIRGLAANLNDYSNYYDNTDYVKKIRFIKMITNTIIDLQKIFHYSINTDLLNYRLKSELSDIDSLFISQNPYFSSPDNEIEFLNSFLPKKVDEESDE